MHQLHSFFTALFILLNTRLCVFCPRESGCKFLENKLTCAQKFDESIQQNNQAIVILETCNLNTDFVNLHAIVKNLPNVANITITDSVIKRLEGYIPFRNNVKVIHFRNLTVTELDRNFFHNTRHLEVLDLKNNSLTYLHVHSNSSIDNISKIYLSGNKWNCSKHLNWVLQLNESAIKDIDSVKCFGPAYPERPLVKVAQFAQDMHKTCPKFCNCSLAYVVRHPITELYSPKIEVVCSGKELTALPISLPKNTKTLKLEKNYIDDLTPLVENPIYEDVQDLYLDHNYVSSIEVLEGSSWLANFRVLSLHGNKLTELPTYAIDNALQDNPNMPNAIMIYLGNNPWRCDCVFTPGFQDMLVKYQPQIQDLPHVKCSYVQGDENSMLPITQLSRASVCRLPNEYSVRALDLLNGILASLIVLILGKLAYDYYYFKRTGRLPWIVTKMP